MSRIAVLVEGETEQKFVNHLVRPHLWSCGVDIFARLPGRQVRRGGTRSWESVRGDVVRTLKGRGAYRCAIMLDYYRLPHGWPGRRDAMKHVPEKRARVVESALQASVTESIGGDLRPGMFLPYIQLHEFEALLFSDTSKLAHAIASAPVHKPVDELIVAERLAQILEPFGDPELINDGPHTAPSKRILDVAPYYDKATMGPIVAERIGLQDHSPTLQPL